MTAMQPTVLCYCLLFLFLLVAAVDGTGIQAWTFKKNQKASNFSLSVLHENPGISRIQCIVECSQTKGCFTLEYKRSGSTCTKYRLFRNEDGKAAPPSSAPDAHSFTMNDPRGQHHGETCSCHVDCVDDRTQCRDNVCTCLAGYSLNPKDGSCIKDRKPQHYDEKCSRSSECVDNRTQCIANKCKCDVGYSFNPKDRSCIEECDNYGTAFSLLAYKYCSHGPNDETWPLPNFKRCSEKCRQIKRFICRSFELWNGACYLFNDSRLAVPKRHWGEYHGCLHYQRNCA